MNLKIVWLILVHLLAVMGIPTIIKFYHFISPTTLPISQLAKINIQATPIDRDITLGQLCNNLGAGFDHVFGEEYGNIGGGSGFSPDPRVWLYLRLDGDSMMVFADGIYYPCASCETFDLVRANIFQDQNTKNFVFDGYSYVTRPDLTIREYLTFQNQKGGDNLTQPN